MNVRLAIPYARAVKSVLVSFLLLLTTALVAAAQELILQPVGAPQVTGAGAGKRAVWRNAGTVGGATVDIVGVMTDAALDHSLTTGNGQIQITSAAQDVHYLDMYIYSAGTYDLASDSGGVPVIADVHIQINDIDGPSNEQVYVELCSGQVEYVRIDRNATTRRSFVAGPAPVGTEIFVLSGDRNYSNQPVSGLEIYYPQTSVFRFGRTANSRFLVRLANPTYDEADTFDLKCGDFRTITLVDDLKEQVLGQPVTLNILYNDTVSTENNNGPANASRLPSTYGTQAVDLIAPTGAINQVTDSSGHLVGFDVIGEGTWSYDDNTGELTFTPFAAFFGVPTPIDYRFQRPENTTGVAYSAPARVSIDIGALGLLKTATLVDTNVNGYADPGETIAYVFTAENFGNVTLTNVTLAETQFSGKGATPVMQFQAATGLSPEGTLEPGERAVYTATYTLVPEDLDTTISNQARATATTPGGTEVSDLSDSENPSDGDGEARNGPGAGRDDPTTIYAGSGPDRGDAPLSYGDPQHADTAQYRIGAVNGDGDSSAQHSADASGDDLDGNDDDDETMLPQLYGGLTRTVTIPVSEPAPGTGRLQVFVDFGADGSFLTPGDQVGTDLRDGGPQDLDGAVNGQISFAVAVPPTAPLVPTFARLRWSSVAGLNAIAAAADGEVEDHAITLKTPPDADRGDAPASYGDPQHVVEGPGAPTIYLGSVPPDVDLVSQAGAGATGDDLDGSDDEDGVTLPQLYAGGLTEVTVNVAEPAAGTAYLQAFVDFDGDGTFAGEQVASDLQDGGTLDKDGAVNGAITFEFTVPAGATTLPTHARFRWSTDLTGAETAFDGEVEDYGLTISSDPPPFICDASLYAFSTRRTTLSRLTFSDAGGSYAVTATTVGSTGSNRDGPWGFNELDGYFYGVDQGRRRLYRVDGGGTFTDLGNISGARTAADAGDILPNGRMIYEVDEARWHIVDLSGAGAATAVGDIDLSFDVFPDDLAYNPIDGLVYGIDRSSRRLFSVAVNRGVPGTRTPQLIGPAIYSGVFDSLWFDRDGRLYGYSNSTNNLYLISTVTGEAQLIMTLPFDEGDRSDGASCRGPAPIPFGAVSGNVFEDRDASDIKEAGEPNYGAGIGLTIFADNGTPANFGDDLQIAVTETLPDGTYGFGDLLINTTYRILLDETDPDLGPGATIGTSNPLTSVAVGGNAATEDQDFGFDAAEADLSITKFAAASGTATPRSSATPGDLIDWVITVENIGPGSPSGVKVIDRIPDGYEYVSDSAPNTGDTYDPATGLWFVDEILAGTSETLTVTVRMRDTGETTNRTEIVYSSLPDPDSDPDVGHLVDDLGDGSVDDDEAAYALARIVDTRRLAGRVFLDTGAGGGSAHDSLVNGAEAGVGGGTLRLIDSAGTEIAAPVIGSDGSWSASLPSSVTGAVTLELIAAEGRIAISERTAGLPALSNADPHDGRFTFTPDPGSDYTDLDFGVIETPRLTQDQVAAIMAGQVISLPHRYTASSEATVAFSTNVTTEAPAGAYSIAVFRDTDCDGAADSPLSAPVGVSPGAELCLVVRVSAGAGVGAGSALTYDLIATTGFARTSASHVTRNTDRIAASSEAAVVLRKTVRNLTLGSAEGTTSAGAPGDVLAYRIYLDNTSSETVSNLTIHDRTPPYTVLGAAPASPSAVASQLNCLLVVPASAAPGYAGVLQWDCSGMLPPGDSGFVNFEVRILD